MVSAAWPLSCHSREQRTGRGTYIDFTAACSPQTQQVHCPPHVAQHATLRVVSLVPAQLCMTKAGVISLLMSREALLWNYSWKKRLQQSGCLFRYVLWWLSGKKGNQPSFWTDVTLWMCHVSQEPGSCSLPSPMVRYAFLHRVTTVFQILPPQLLNFWRFWLSHQPSKWTFPL